MSEKTEKNKEKVALTKKNAAKKEFIRQKMRGVSKKTFTLQH